MTAALVAICAGAAIAAPGAAPAGDLNVELNKLETYEKGCRAYIVLNNGSETPYQSVKLDLVLFQPDGVIARRITVDLAPIKASKKAVQSFDIENLACDKISSVLVNDVMECKSDTGPVADCLAKISLSSVAGAPLTK